MDDWQIEGEMTMTITHGAVGSSLFGQKHKAYLEYKNESGQHQFPLDAPQAIIGRSKQADLRVDDHYISNMHARILVIHNFYFIEDLNSRNGILVNGKTVKFLRLANGDVVGIGHASLRFVELDTIDRNYIKKLNLEAVQALALAVEAKDPYTKGHSERVSEVAENLASRLKLPEAHVERVKIAGILHDIGKIGVPEAILQKKGRLDEAEIEIIQRHPMEGLNILKPLDFLADILPAVGGHHERYDGRGYPAGAKGDAIPLWARIIQVADTFDAMTSNRPYREAFSKVQAKGEIERCSGTQFDPEVACAMLEILI